MLGKNHLIVGTDVAVCTFIMMPTFEEKHWIPEWIHLEQLKIFHQLGSNMWIVAIVTGILYLLGNLLPDIDSPNSLLGRYFYLPVGHRRFTHSIWFLMLIAIGSVYVPMLWSMFLGALVHILVDKCSKSGDCLLWPITGYREYPNGAQVAKGHKWYLYRTGAPSEYVWVTAITLGTIVLVGNHVLG